MKNIIKDTEKDMVNNKKINSRFVISIVSALTCYHENRPRYLKYKDNELGYFEYNKKLGIVSEYPEIYKILKDCIEDIKKSYIVNDN